MTSCQFLGQVKIILFLSTVCLTVGSLFFLDSDLKHKSDKFYMSLSRPRISFQSETFFFLIPAMIWKEQGSFKVGNAVTELLYLQYVIPPFF